jgi:DNA-binding transcriptional LysR family regulator
MELYLIRYFLSVCEHGSFSRAADACDISQPAITAAIKKLEAEIGSPLLHREGKRVVMTELGCRMRPHLQQVLEETQRAEEVARNFRLLKQAPLRIGTMSTIGPAQVAGFLGAYRSRHPGVELTVEEGPLPALLRDLEAGGLEIAIVSSPEALPDAFRAETLYRERYVVAFPRGHAFERLEQVTLQDTSGKDYVDRLACELREIVMGVCRERGVTLYAGFRTDREDWVQSMVLAGLGFAFMPEHSVTLPSVLTRPLVDPPVEREVVAVEVRGRKRSTATGLFFDALHAHRWLKAEECRNLLIAT